MLLDLSHLALFQTFGGEFPRCEHLLDTVGLLKDGSFAFVLPGFLDHVQVVASVINCH